MNLRDDSFRRRVQAIFNKYGFDIVGIESEIDPFIQGYVIEIRFAKNNIIYHRRFILKIAEANIDGLCDVLEKEAWDYWFQLEWGIDDESKRLKALKKQNIS